MPTLDEYYNKFNEEKRLNSRHGQVEFQISMKYIHKYAKPGDAILDVGAATGRYSIPLFEEGYQVTAVEPVKHNLGRLKQKNPNITAFQGNAVRMKRLKDNSFDLTLLFGPMYHLCNHEDKVKAMLEAKRVTKPGGVIMVAYVMNDYAVVTYGFKEKHVLESLKDGRMDESFHTVALEGDLYDYLTLDDINALNKECGMKRELIFSPDGPANYMRPFLNQLSEEEFEQFVKYQETVCERPDLLGAGAHTVDVLRVEK